MVAGLGTLDYGCEDRYAGDGVPPHLAIATGLGGKANLLINGEFRAETARCSKCDHLLRGRLSPPGLHDDDVNEAEEMRMQRSPLIAWPKSGF